MGKLLTEYVDLSDIKLAYREHGKWCWGHTAAWQLREEQDI